MRAYVLFSLVLFVGHSAVAKTCQVSRDVSGPFKHEWVSFTDDVRQNNQVLLIGTDSAERERQIENDAQSLIKRLGNEPEIIEFIKHNQVLVDARNQQADAIQSLLSSQHAPRIIAIDPVLRKNENIQFGDLRAKDTPEKAETFAQGLNRAQELVLAISIRTHRDLSIESARKLLLLAIGPLMKVAVDRADLFNHVDVESIDTNALDKMASSNTLPADAWSERIYITEAKNLDSLTLTVNSICQKAALAAPAPTAKVVPAPAPTAPAATPTGPAATPPPQAAAVRSAPPAPVLRPIVTQFRPRRAYTGRFANRYARATRASTYLRCPQSPFTTCHISGGYVHIRPVGHFGRYGRRSHRRY